MRECETFPIGKRLNERCFNSSKNLSHADGIWRPQEWQQTSWMQIYADAVLFDASKSILSDTLENRVSNYVLSGNSHNVLEVFRQVAASSKHCLRAQKSREFLTLAAFRVQTFRVLEISFDATDNADMFHILSRETH